jgi:hypothetical protein
MVKLSETIEDFEGGAFDRTRSNQILGLSVEN